MTEAQRFIGELGHRISRLRKMRGYNQFEFADRSGKMINTISKIERGIGDPRLSTLLDISRALDISILELLDINEPQYNFQSTGRAEEKLADILSTIRQCDEKSLQLVADLLGVLAKK